MTHRYLKREPPPSGPEGHWVVPSGRQRELNFMRRIGICARAASLAMCSAGLLLTMGMAQRADADSAPVIAGYEVYAGGFHVLTSVLEIRLDDRHYNARLAARLAGMPGWFVEWAADVRSDGTIEGGELDPEQYTLDRVRRGESQKTVLDFGREGEVGVSFDPIRNDSNGLVPPEFLLESLDPLSGLLSVINTVTEGGECDVTIPVFDGRRRYDLVFTDQGMVELNPSRRSGYAGPARRCRMQLEPVVGAFRQNDDDDDDDSFWSTKPEDAPRRRLDIWLAEPIAGGPTLPVRMVGRSSIGAVVIHLQNVHIPANTADAEPPAGCSVTVTC
jgi:hypothetical protein